MNDKLSEEELLEAVETQKRHSEKLGCKAYCLLTIKELEQIMVLIKKPRVDKEFVEKWGDKFPACTWLDLSTNLKLIKEMLAKAGVEVKE